MRLEPRFGATVRAVAVASLVSLAVLGTASAEDDYRALSPAAAQAVDAPREQPVNRNQWESRLRTADSFGPPALRAGDAAFLAAARAARWGEALGLLKSGQAAANSRDDQDDNPLVRAARAGQDELVRELLKRGADTTRVSEDGFTALGAAAFTGQRSTVRLLLRAGVDSKRWGASGQTALHLASIAGRVEILEEFSRARIDIDMLNVHRESALDVAAAAGQQDAMGWLIKAGADLVSAGRR